MAILINVLRINLYLSFLISFILFSTVNNLIVRIRVVIREGPGRTLGVSPSTGSGQRREVPLRVRVEIFRGRPVGPVHSGNDVFQNLLKLF